MFEVTISSTWLTQTFFRKKEIGDFFISLHKCVNISQDK